MLHLGDSSSYCRLHHRSLRLSNSPGELISRKQIDQEKIKLTAIIIIRRLIEVIVEIDLMVKTVALLETHRNRLKTKIL